MLKKYTKKENKTKEENKKKSVVPRYMTFLILSIILGGIFTALTSYAATIAASNISYDNSTSGLSATNAQDAIDETSTLLSKMNKFFIQIVPTINTTGVVDDDDISYMTRWTIYRYDSDYIYLESSYVFQSLKSLESTSEAALGVTLDLPSNIDYRVSLFPFSTDSITMSSGCPCSTIKAEYWREGSDHVSSIERCHGLKKDGTITGNITLNMKYKKSVYLNSCSNKLHNGMTSLWICTNGICKNTTVTKMQNTYTGSGTTYACKSVETPPSLYKLSIRIPRTPELTITGSGSWSVPGTIT